MMIYSQNSNNSSVVRNKATKVNQHHTALRTVRFIFKFLNEVAFTKFPLSKLWSAVIFQTPSISAGRYSLPCSHNIGDSPIYRDISIIQYHIREYHFTFSCACLKLVDISSNFSTIFIYLLKCAATQHERHFPLPQTVLALIQFQYYAQWRKDSPNLCLAKYR